VFGKRAPTLLTSEMVGLLRPGAVVVDLAADQGGNCAATQADEIVTVGGVTVIGTLNLPALLPSDASRLYANNLVNLFRYLSPDAGPRPDASDPIVAAVCVTRGGQIVNETLRAAGPAASATASAAMRTTADATEAGATR
jgi:H+-translocating NAD(P) transhydrogenase subunit alpha